MSASDELVVGGAGWMGVSRPLPGFDGLRRFESVRLDSGARRRLERLQSGAAALAADWRSRCVSPYVALSGGKDSCVTLHVIRRVDPSVPAVYGEDEDGTFRDVTAVIDWWDTQGPRVHRWYWESWPRLFAVHGLDSTVPARRFGAAFDRETAEYDGAACGYRSDENNHRRLHHAIRGALFRQQSPPRWRVDPLWNWSANDVWAYIAVHRLPYAALYDLDDGVPRERRRVGSPFGATSATYGRIARLKRFYPDLYRRFVETCPEARNIT